MDLSLDDSWIDANADNRKATYSNLPAGKYTFTVQGSNIDGVWNKTPIELVVIVLVPWWKTTLFLIGVVVMIILLL